MKKIFLMLAGLLLTISFTTAGNENPPCDCSNNNGMDLHGSGTAIWVSAMQIRCEGDVGTCWSLTYDGKWILTINTQPPIIFDNHSPQTDPPAGPSMKEKGDGFTIYAIDGNIWRQR